MCAVEVSVAGRVERTERRASCARSPGVILSACSSDARVVEGRAGARAQSIVNEVFEATVESVEARVETTVVQG